jgi:hypothetical protein
MVALAPSTSSLTTNIGYLSVKPWLSKRRTTKLCKKGLSVFNSEALECEETVYLDCSERAPLMITPDVIEVDSGGNNCPVSHYVGVLIDQRRFQAYLCSS